MPLKLWKMSIHSSSAILATSANTSTITLLNILITIIQNDPRGSEQLCRYGVLLGRRSSVRYSTMSAVCRSSAVSWTICFSECNRCASPKDCSLHLTVTVAGVWFSIERTGHFLLPSFKGTVEAFSRSPRSRLRHVESFWSLSSPRPCEPSACPGGAQHSTAGTHDGVQRSSLPQLTWPSVSFTLQTSAAINSRKKCTTYYLGLPVTSTFPADKSALFARVIVLPVRAQNIV